MRVGPAMYGTGPADALPFAAVTSRSTYFNLLIWVFRILVGPGFVMVELVM